MHRLLVATALTAAVTGCNFAEPLFTAGRSLEQPRVGGVAETSVLDSQTALPPQEETTTTPAAPGCVVEWNPADAQRDMVIDGVVATSPTVDSTNNGVRATAGHVGGRYYFEVTVESTGIDNYNQIAVIAGGPNAAGSWFEEVGCSGDVGHCAGVEGYAAGDVISVAADLDAGRVDFAVNGVLSQGNGWLPRTVAVVPGAGPFFPGAVLSEQGVVRANFGAEAFAFAPPEGFLPWADGFAVDDDGRCVSDALPPVTPAPIRADVPLSSYDAGRSDEVALVVLGVYEPNDSGVIDVSVTRPGRYALDLSSYTAARWQISAGDGVVVERVRVSGYEGATVDVSGVADGVATVDVEVGNGSGGVCAIAWPYDFGGCDTLSVVGTAERESGSLLSYFAGTYRAGSFTLE